MVVAIHIPAVARTICSKTIMVCKLVENSSYISHSPSNKLYCSFVATHGRHTWHTVQTTDLVIGVLTGVPVIVGMHQCGQIAGNLAAVNWVGSVCMTGTHHYSIVP